MKYITLQNINTKPYFRWAPDLKLSDRFLVFWVNRFYSNVSCKFSTRDIDLYRRTQKLKKNTSENHSLIKYIYGVSRLFNKYSNISDESLLNSLVTPYIIYKIIFNYYE